MQELVLEQKLIYFPFQILMVSIWQEVASPDDLFILTRIGSSCTCFQWEVGKVRMWIMSQCLDYTLKAWLSPRWNQVGTLLAKGRNFLTSTVHQTLPAVKFAVSIKGVASKEINAKYRKHEITNSFASTWPGTELAVSVARLDMLFPPIPDMQDLQPGSFTFVLPK